MLTFWRKKLHVDDPRARDRVLGLLRERGPLFLEAAFRHVSSDYYILAGPEDVARVFDWFRGRGGMTPLYIRPAADTVGNVTPLVETNTSTADCTEQIARALDHHRLLVQVSAPGSAPSFHIVGDDEEWQQVSATLAPGTRVTGYDAFAIGGRRSAIVIWAGQLSKNHVRPANKGMKLTRPGVGPAGSAASQLIPSVVRTVEGKEDVA